MSDGPPEWVKFSAAKWLTGTATISPGAEYALFRLCAFAYEKGESRLHLSNKALMLALRQSDEAEMQEHLDELETARKIVRADGGEIFIPSAAKRIEEANDFRAAKSRRGKAGAKGRWGLPSSQSNAKAMPKQCQSNAKAMPDDSQNRTEHNRRGRESELPLSSNGNHDSQTARDKSARDDRVADGFDSFWEGWTPQVKKAEARKAWQKALKHAKAEVIIEAARAHQAAWDKIGRSPQYRPHAATWLNGKCWEEQPITADSPSGKASKPGPAEEAALESVKKANG